MIATRLLRLNHKGAYVKIPVRVFAPEKQGPAWSCRYEIEWPHGKRTSAVVGADSMQALLFAMQIIGAEIYSSDYHKSGHLMWDAPGSGYGFPLTQNLRDLLTGDDARFL
jgi:hypothetical protein